MTRARLVAGLILAFAPGTAHAQLETFVQSTRALAAAAGQPTPARTTAMGDAASRMAAALAQWDRNIAALEARVDRDLGSAPAERQYQLHVERGVAYRARGRLADAQREFDAAAQLRPDGSDLQLLRGLTLEALGRPEDAARALRHAWTLDPGNVAKAYYAWDRRGLTPTDQQRARATLADGYRQLPAAAGTSAPPFLVLDAIPDALVRAPVVGDERTARPFGLIAAGQYSAAVAMLTGVAGQNAAAAADESPLAHFVRAQASEADNRLPDARREYAAALPGTLTGRSTIYVALGRLAQVEGDLQGAVGAFTHAVRLNPNDPTMHQELAGAYAAQGRTDDAFVELIAGLLVDPGSATLHAALGRLHLEADRPEAALPALTRALELSPAGFEVRYALATALTRLGRTAEAAAQLELFDQFRRESLDQRRQDIQREVEKEEAIRRGLATTDSTP